MEIGVITHLANEGDCFAKMREYELKLCQLMCWDASMATPEIADSTLRHAKSAGVKISAFWGGLPAPQEWNFKEGPTTLGIVPLQYREERVSILKRWADFAERVGAKALVTHCGFIPENMTDPEYDGVVATIREIAEYCEGRGLDFWLETGQETPVVLLRTIERVGMSNVGINLDPANLIMYGKANPIDALDVFGAHVREVHIKDGLYPVNGDELGQEVPVGQGKTNFPVFLSRLREIGYRGNLIIEREIWGDQQTRDIQAAIRQLNEWFES